MLSPLLANIYLDPLDRLLAERGLRAWCDRPTTSLSWAGAARRPIPPAISFDLVGYGVADDGLTLGPTKIRVGECRTPGQGFEALGSA